MRGKAGFSPSGYHPGSYGLPDTREILFQVICGAILTQNTAWKNAEVAIHNLESAGILCPEQLLELHENELGSLIRPAGYYNQKAKKLKVLFGFLEEHGYTSFHRVPSRDSLLSLWGIGSETADSILTYGYGIGVFIADSYARRLFSRLGLCIENETYDRLQQLIHKQAGGRSCEFWNEFHALIVTHAKTVCVKKPDCIKCFLLSECHLPGAAGFHEKM